MENDFSPGFVPQRGVKLRAMSKIPWRQLLVPAALVFLYLYPFPYFSKLRSANEMPRIYLTQEIVDRGTFRLDARWSELQLGSTFDVSTTPDGHRYSNKAPGTSFLAVPGYLLIKGWHRLVGGEPSLAEVTRVFRVTAVTIPALLFLCWFFSLTRRFAPDAAPRRTALLAYALGSLAFPYALLFFSHQTAAACAGGAFVCAVRRVRGETRWPNLTSVGIGLLAALAVVVDYQSVFAALAIAIYLLLRSQRRWPDVALATLGAIPPAAALMFYHQTCFGSPLKTGYSFAVDPACQHGLLGIIGPNLQGLWQALLAPDNGLIVLMPWVLIAIVGGAAIAYDREARARVGAEALLCGIVILAYVLFLGSLAPAIGRAGWSVGPRYIGVAVPFIGWLAAAGFAALDKKPLLRVIGQSLVVVGIVVFVAAAVTYPHWPTSFANPLFDVSFRALRSGMAPHSLGTLIGLRGLASLLPFFAVIGALVLGLFTAGDRRRWVTTVAAILLASAIIWSYHFFSQGTAEGAWNFIVRQWEP